MLFCLLHYRVVRVYAQQILGQACQARVRSSALPFLQLPESRGGGMAKVSCMAWGKPRSPTASPDWSMHRQGYLFLSFSLYFSLSLLSSLLCSKQYYTEINMDDAGCRREGRSKFHTGAASFSHFSFERSCALLFGERLLFCVGTLIFLFFFLFFLFFLSFLPPYNNTTCPPPPPPLLSILLCSSISFYTYCLSSHIQNHTFHNVPSHWTQ